MTIDTQDKRFSAQFIGSPWRLSLPVPNGVIGAENRAQSAYHYALNAPVAPPEVGSDYIITFRRRRR